MIMPAKLRLERQRFGRCVVQGNAGTQNGKTLWDVLCDCGTSFVAIGGNLRSGITESCGCLKIEVLKTKPTTHGGTIGRKTTREYNSWLSMRRRCYYPKHEYYENCGGKGIEVEERWRESFETFLLDMGECPKGYTLQRKDSGKDFCKENCAWQPVPKISMEQRRANIRGYRLWTFFRLTPEDWNKILDFQKSHPVFSLLSEGRLGTEHRHSDGKIRGVLNFNLNRAYGYIERVCPDNTSAVLRALADFHDQHPATLALGKETYGILGKAQHKKRMIYGSPSGPIKEPKKGKSNEQ